MQSHVGGFANNGGGDTGAEGNFYSLATKTEEVYTDLA